MNALLLDAGSPVTCQPVTSTRALADCLVMNRRLAALQEEALRGAGFTVVPRAESAVAVELALFVTGAAWLSPALLAALRQETQPVVVRDAAGRVLAWTGAEMPGADAKAIPTDAASFLIVYPWDLLRLNERLVGAIAQDDIRGRVSARVELEGHLVLGEGSRILPGVYIEGNAVIGRNCKIGPNCYIRGSTTVGDGCHIGQAVEVKNSILYDDVAIGHLSYCGDSIIGSHTNFGAGTVTANFRHDGKNHRSMVDGQLLDTGRRKFGAIIGDHVHTGIHTSIYPGRKLWPGTSTRPGTVVQADLTEPGLV